MQGLMQDWPLLISKILDHGTKWHGEREIVSRTIEDGSIHRYTFAEMGVRARKIASALDKRGVKLGDRIGTLAWNTYRHVESWYGISCMGAVTHTLNPRLFPEQISYIINHAEDRMIFVDLTFVPILEGLAAEIPNVEAFIIMTDRANMPETTLKNVICYEELLEEGSDDYVWPEFDENTASSLCYTSGTTGNPKGVLYSHRGNVLHTFTSMGKDVMGMGSQDVVLPVVPMFHANAWALPYACLAAGCKVVLPGAQMDGESIAQLLIEENVTITAAVPTVWLMLLTELQSTGAKLPDLKRVIIGGSAVPRSMIDTFEKDYDVSVLHAWGMTEMSPMGTLCELKAGMEDFTHEQKLDIKVKQGRVPFGVEMRIIDDEGTELPHDGVAFGKLLVRGPAIASGYLKGEGGNVLDKDGWFDTGDVATIDALGYMQITDRAKDVIKSGGEWISSIDIENHAVGHPEVAEAAVIGLAHPKWDERPLLIIVKAEGKDPSKESILDYLDGKIAKWWMPNDVAFVDEIPHTATGKIQKVDLRKQFDGYQFPDA
ncbi:MAG: 3-(methylthio)propionyl-CoA ligase [Alphaproteobacteria bacterium]